MEGQEEGFIELKGDLLGYGTVYYQPNVAANVISFFNLSKCFSSVIYDIKIHDAYIGTRDKGMMLKFIPSNEGLYYYNFHQSVCRQTESKQEHAMVIRTVEEVKRNFSKREVEDTEEAR